MERGFGGLGWIFFLGIGGSGDWTVHVSVRAKSAVWVGAGVDIEASNRLSL